MTENELPARMPDRMDDDEIDLVSLFLVIWKRKKMILLGTAAITLVAVIISFMIPKVYLSNAFYKLGPGITYSDYKASSHLVYDPVRLNNYARSSTYQTIFTISDSFETPEQIRKCIKPQYILSEENGKKNDKVPNDPNTLVTGFQFSYEANNTRKAHDTLLMLGDYAKSCLSYYHVSNFIRQGINVAELDFKTNANSIIDLEFQISGYTRKATDIQEILIKYPDSEKIVDRQVVSLQEGAHRYLSPVSQLVGIESILADYRQDISGLLRVRGQLAIKKSFYSKCNEMMGQWEENGDSLLTQMQIIRNDLAAELDLNQDASNYAVNNISNEIQKLIILYNDYRFVYGPTQPEKHIKPNKRNIVMITFFVSLFFLTMMSFILEWWGKNKNLIQAADSHARKLNE